jgi:hypothetical protein
MQNNTKLLLGVAIIGAGAYLINQQLKAQKEFLGFGKNERPNFIRKIFMTKASAQARVKAAEQSAVQRSMVSNPEAVKRYTKGRMS